MKHRIRCSNEQMKIPVIFFLVSFAIIKSRFLHELCYAKLNARKKKIEKKCKMNVNTE